MNPILIHPQRYRVSYLGNKQRMREQEGCLQTMYYRKGLLDGLPREGTGIAGGSSVTLWYRGGSTAFYKPGFPIWFKMVMR